MDGFEWDAEKNRRNREKHGVPFELAAEVFADENHLSLVDDRHDYGERRVITIGRIARQVVVVVVHTDRAGRIRIISARKASRKERRLYNAGI